jgi:hypothetical protein
MSSVVIKNKSQFRYFFPNETGSVSDAFGIIGGLRFANNSVGWEFGELLGIRSFVAYSDTINSIETTVHGDLDGYVFKQESGNSFNGVDVIAIYATPFFTLIAQNVVRYFINYLFIPDQKARRSLT